MSTIGPPPVPPSNTNVVMTVNRPNRVDGAHRDGRATVHRPAAGYVVVPDGLDAIDAQVLLRRWGQALAAAAARQGYRLDAVFADVRGRGDPGLYELVTHVRQGRARLVVVPDLPTLTGSVCLDGADRLTAGRFLRAPVLTMDPAHAGQHR